MSILFTKTDGNLQNRLTNEDHISGLLFYGQVAPSGFGGEFYKQFFSIKEAEALGILADNAYKVVHYHISEYFRINPQSELWVAMLLTTTTETNAILAFQNASEGRMRQLGVMYPTDTLITTLLTVIAELQSQAMLCYNEEMPLHIVYAPQMPDNLVIATLPNLRNGVSNYVSVLISQDGAAKGATLFRELDYSISCIGACLGAISRANVHENIGWVRKFNVASAELDVPALSNGLLFKAVFITEAAIDAVSNKGYILLRKHRGTSGTYFNDSHVANAFTSDFTYIEHNRTIDKAIRGIRTFLRPEFNRPLYVNVAGQLRPDLVGYLESRAKAPVEAMFNDGELSNFELTIDPNDVVTTTNKVVVKIKLQPVGVNRVMEVFIGFTAKITT